MFASNDKLMHVFMTSSEDGMVKMWDRRQAKPAAQMASHTAGYGRQPFHSVSTNHNLIAAGTNENILWWDVHSMSKPIGTFIESHNDDVTQIATNEAGSIVISCSIDNVLNMFDLTLRDAKQTQLQEDELIDGAYSSTQPLLDCGFLTNEIIWTQTSINTVEFVRLIDATMFL